MSESTDIFEQIGNVRARQMVTVTGVVNLLRVRSGGFNAAFMECTIQDESGSIDVVFWGYRRIAGLTLGRKATFTGRAVERKGRLAILNPRYTLHPNDE
jgi:RecG-like helicase